MAGLLPPPDEPPAPSSVAAGSGGAAAPAPSTAGMIRLSVTTQSNKSCWSGPERPHRCLCNQVEQDIPGSSRPLRGVRHQIGIRRLRVLSSGWTALQAGGACLRLHCSRYAGSNSPFEGMARQQVIRGPPALPHALLQLRCPLATEAAAQSWPLMPLPLPSRKALHMQLRS